MNPQRLSGLFLIGLFGLSLLLIAVGMAGGRQETKSVTGRILVDGKPAAVVQITLFCEDGRSSTATSGRDGRFEIHNLTGSTVAVVLYPVGSRPTPPKGVRIPQSSMEQFAAKFGAKMGGKKGEAATADGSNQTARKSLVAPKATVSFSEKYGRKETSGLTWNIDEEPFKEFDIPSAATPATPINAPKQ